MNSRIRISRYLYTAAAWLFVAGILTQVFLIGLSLLGGRPSWPAHIDLGHSLSIVALLMVVLAYTGRLPHPMKPLTWLALVIYILLADVVIFMRELAPLVAALHPVLAVLLFGIVGFLAIRAWRLVRESVDTGMVAHPRAEGTGD
jgi:mercuric ion transport protein